MSEQNRCENYAVGYVGHLSWTDSATEHEKALVGCNILTFARFVDRQDGHTIARLERELSAMTARAEAAEARLKRAELLADNMKYAIDDLLNHGNPIPDYGHPDCIAIPHQANPQHAVSAIREWEHYRAADAGKGGGGREVRMLDQTRF